MKTEVLETPAFTIEPGAIVHQGGQRPSLVFSAPSTVHVDGRLEVDVSLLMFDDKDRFIGRCIESSNESFVGKRAGWRHEIESAELEQASRLAYEIRYELSFRRSIMAGEIPELPAEADESDLLAWFDLDTRSLSDRVMSLRMSWGATRRAITINYLHGSQIATDNCRTSFELELLDGSQQTRFLKRFTGSLTNAQARWDDTNVRLERHVLRALKFFELRGETEVRATAELPVSQ